MTEQADTGNAALIAVANAAALVEDTAGRAQQDMAVVHTPYGKAVVHLDEHGADVELSEGSTVHVRFGGDTDNNR